MIEDILQRSAKEVSQNLDADKEVAEKERLIAQNELSERQTTIATRLIQEIMFIEEGLRVDK